jgi:hypothetical protein
MVLTAPDTAYLKIHRTRKRKNTPCGAKTVNLNAHSEIKAYLGRVDLTAFSEF